MKARQVKLILCWWRFSAFCHLWILTLKQSEDPDRVAQIGQTDSQFKLTWTGQMLVLTYADLQTTTCLSAENIS